MAYSVQISDSLEQLAAAVDRRMAQVEVRQ
jgi:hypothetical protein